MASGSSFRDKYTPRNYAAESRADAQEAVRLLRPIGFVLSLLRKKIYEAAGWFLIWVLANVLTGGYPLTPGPGYA